MSTLQMEKMEALHLCQIIALEKQCFQTLAWDEDCFLYEINQNPFGHYFVGMLEDEVVCYLGLHIIFEDCHITTVGTHPDFRKQGFGREILQHGIRYAKALGVENMSLEVRVSNVAAKKLYASFGFQEGALRKNYYPDNQEDAMLMWVKI